MTTNCIQKPQDGYMSRIFTSGLVAWPGVPHIGTDTRFHAGDRRRPGAPRFPEDDAGARPSPSASATTPCWAWPTR